MSGNKEQRVPILDDDDKVSVSPSANSDVTVIVDKDATDTYGTFDVSSSTIITD